MMNIPFMPRTVGVAPGTTTVHLGANPVHYARGNAPEMARVNAYDRTHDEAFRRGANPASLFTRPRVNVGVTNEHGLQGHMWNPYQGDFMRLQGVTPYDYSRQGVPSGFQLQGDYAYSRQGIPSGFQLYGTGEVDTRAKMRWDLIAGVGGAALIVSLGAGLIASLLK
jgi:hypothetical protein